MHESHPTKKRRNWMRIGGPLASLALHLLVVWLLLQRVGPAMADLPEVAEVALRDAAEVQPLDEPPPVEPDMPDEPRPAVPDVGIEVSTEVDEVPGSGPVMEDMPGIDLASVPMSPLTVRGLLEGGGGASFGYSGRMAGDLVGTMYDLKRDARGADRTPNYLADVRTVLAGNLSSSAFSGFYRVTNQVYMSHLFVPVMPAERGPTAFAAGDQVKPQNWLVHYRGNIRPPKSGRYRFVGMFDDLLMVLVDGKIVMEFLWTGDPTPWSPSEHVGKHACYAGRPLVYGDWVAMDAGESRRIDILVGEHPGGLVGGVLMVQDEQHRYESTPEGRPILPVFTVQQPTVEERVRMVRFEQWQFDADIPVFNTRPAPKLAEKDVEELTIEII